MQCEPAWKTTSAPKDRLARSNAELVQIAARHVPSMVGALPHQPKPGHYFNSDIDAPLLTPSSVAAGGSEGT